VVLCNDGFGLLRAHEYVHVPEASSRDRVDSDLTRGEVVADPPVLCLRVVVVNTDPAVGRVLEHVEGVHTVDLLAGETPVL